MHDASDTRDDDDDASSGNEGRRGMGEPKDDAWDDASSSVVVVRG